MGWPTREELPETCTRDGGSLSEGETCSGPAAWHGHRAPTSASSLPDSPAGPPGRASSPRTSILITSPQGCPIPASPNLLSPPSPSTSLGHQADVSRHTPRRSPLVLPFGRHQNHPLGQQQSDSSPRAWWGPEGQAGGGSGCSPRAGTFLLHPQFSLGNPQRVCQPWLSHSWRS